MFKKILVATDFSEASAGAVRYGRELAARFGAALHLLHVVEEPIVPAVWAEAYVSELPALRDQLERDAQAQLRGLLDAGDRDRLRAVTVTRFGAPHHEIIAYAGQEATDLIVVGTHGRGAVAQIVMGSVAERVVRHAPCPVLTVGRLAARDGGDAAAPAGAERS